MKLSLTIAFVFQMIVCNAFANSLKPFDLQEIGVQNRGFEILATDPVAKQIIQKEPRCQKLMNYVQEGMNTIGLVVRWDGEPVFTMRPYDISSKSVFKLFSASKTVTALALGAYLYQNPTLKLETKVSTLVDLGTHIGDRPFASRDKISLFDLISMGTGLDWCEHAKCVAIDMIKATYGKQNKDTLKYVLSKPMKTRPGKRYNYSSGNYMILEKLLKDHMGATKYKTFYQDFLFKPLGIKKATLETDGEGLIYGASGVWLNNQDYSKIGQLIASRGVWKGQRLISDDFIETMMTPTPAAINASKAIRRTEGPVGASLWTNRKLPRHRHLLPGVTESMVFTSGLYGQFMLMFPDQNVVISRLGGDKDHSATWYKFVRDASGCFARPGLFDASKIKKSTYGPGPGNNLTLIEGALEALGARLPMNAFAQEMCSCLYESGGIERGIEDGVAYCQTLRPIPDQLEGAQEFGVTVDTKKKEVTAFFADDPDETSAVAKSFKGRACQLIKRARPVFGSRAQSSIDHP